MNIDLEISSTYAISDVRKTLYYQAVTTLIGLFADKKCGFYIDYKILNNVKNSIDYIDAIISSNKSIIKTSENYNFDTIFVFVPDNFIKTEYDLKIFSSIFYKDIEIIYITELKNDHSDYSLL
jgi:hypothetical protein